MSDYELGTICKDLSHQCITSIVPDEASFFEPIWQVLHKQIFQSKNVLSPKSWWEKSTYSETLSGLGLYGGEDLRAVSIISTLSALMITMLSSENRTMDRLDILASDYATKFDTPQWALSHIKSLVQRRLSELEVDVGRIASETIEDSNELAVSEDVLIPKQQKQIQKILKKSKKIRKIERKDPFSGIIIGKSEAIRELITSIEQLRDTDGTVTIIGQTGVGKELVAHAIHKISPNCGGPFIPAHLAGYTETLLESKLFGHEEGAFTGAIAQQKGLFELADKGSLFLDEIGDLHEICQVRLLRVLEGNEFERVGGTNIIKADVRLIAATNKDLQRCISEGTFREELFYRLTTFLIRVPPLCERKEDIPILVEHFADDFCKNKGRESIVFSEESVLKLLTHDWPGNVRELKNCVERAIGFAKEGSIEAEHITFIEAGKRRWEGVVIPEYFEKQTIIEVLENCTKVADAILRLPWSKTQFYTKCQKHGINPKNHLRPSQ